MNGANTVAVEKLVGNNYNYWKLCMEAFLQGQDLWDLVSGDETVIPEDTPQNVESRRKWKVKCGKALFALRTSISKEYIEHVRDEQSPKKVWETLERLFTQKNTMRLQFLENDLAGIIQGNLAIPEYFLKIKTLCAEISELDPTEPVSEARLRRYIIRGLRKEFMPFISSIQGWSKQPSIIELENLLSNQEALENQMTNNKPSVQVEEVLYSKDQGKRNYSAYKCWKLWQLDVKNAFLYGELDRDIFMEQPQGFISKEFPDHVCRLKKALYGLKQAPRAWYGKIAQYLDFCGFKSSCADPSLFIKKTPTMCTILLLYVDDMIITGDDNAEITRLQEALSIRFEMKSLGEASCFLGLEVEKSDGYFVSQKRYAASLLNRFRMGESRAMPTPMEPFLRLTKDEGKPLEDATLFRQLVGSLFYLTITRPDIAFSVGVVSQFMDKPCEGHLIAAKRILRYVKSTLNFGLLYKQHVSFSLSGFVDADWAGDVNDRRSTTGYCFNTGSAAVSWCSKKQNTVALSSCEAEYMAATMATQECLWLKRLIQDVVSVFNLPVPIYCDNESAIKLAGNPVFHARTKHIETHYHFVREKVLTEDIELQKIRTEDQVADIFTKALAKAKFEVFRSALGVVSCKFALRGSVKN